MAKAAQGQTEYAAGDQPAEPQVQAQKDQKGVQCPACHWFNSFRVNSTVYKSEGFTQRKKTCQQCGFAILTAEAYIGPAPEKPKK